MDSNGSTSDPNVQRLDYRIESLLEEIRAETDPMLWHRIERLVAALVDLYGAGLERLLQHARDANAAPSFEERMLNDDLVSSLLSLHGLHPLSVFERTQRALALLTEDLAAPDAHVTVVSASTNLVLLRVWGTAPTMVLEALAHVAIRTVEQAAPEVESVRVDGLAQSERLEPLLR